MYLPPAVTEQLSLLASRCSGSACTANTLQTLCNRREDTADAQTELKRCSGHLSLDPEGFRHEQLLAECCAKHSKYVQEQAELQREAEARLACSAAGAEGCVAGAAGGAAAA